jgi:hypothetical protein
VSVADGVLVIIRQSGGLFAQFVLLVRIVGFAVLIIASQFPERDFSPVVLQALFVASELSFDLVKGQFEGCQCIARRILCGGMSDKLVGPFGIDNDFDSEPRVHIDGHLDRRHAFEDVSQFPSFLFDQLADVFSHATVSRGQLDVHV